MSKKAPGRGRALLELLGFDTADIDSFYDDNPRKGEEAVHAGLLEWAGQGPPNTWRVLIDAMIEAGIVQQHVEGLKEHLLKKGVCVCVCVCISVCMRAPLTWSLMYYTHWQVHVLMLVSLSPPHVASGRMTVVF